MTGRLKDSKGFTLIELMIVVAIIAILAAIAIPSFLGIQKKAARSEAKANLEAIALALEGYMAENNDYGPVTKNYSYVCGVGCLKSAFAPIFPTTALNYRLEDVANLGGEYGYNYWVKITTEPAFEIVASAMRGRVAGDVLHPYIKSDGEKGPVGFGW